MTKNIQIQKDYSLSSFNYQLKLPFEMEVCYCQVNVGNIFVIQSFQFSFCRSRVDMEPLMMRVHQPMRPSGLKTGLAPGQATTSSSPCKPVSLVILKTLPGPTVFCVLHVSIRPTMPNGLVQDSCIPSRLSSPPYLK